MKWRAIREHRAVTYVEEIVGSFLKHDDMALAAAVAFYTAFSFAPLVLLVVTVGGFLGEATQDSLLRGLADQLGPRATEVTESVIQSAEAEATKTGTARWIVSVVLLLVSSSAVFGQLQSSLNAIWEAPVHKGSGVWWWLRKRLLSLGMVLAALFILLVSLMLSTVTEHVLPTGDGIPGRAAVFASSLVVSTLLFAAIFRMLPDVPVTWRQVWRGAMITGLLFAIGKLVLGVYLERSDVAKSYGEAAGAIVALLVWVYYSCIILFIGAELTRTRRDAAHADDVAAPALPVRSDRS